ncbi:MAG: 3D-(3,5/4)-trihydroxycyclohexane-1,2-dione acylhydrolase (decyclizing) [Pseudomonadota bacterium]|nr:3D-(3,5/4)-trihydroxycyclohexane-1,2-dione acylhydrolase (decyclizing) [Pseudomonadota bacterium]
MSGDTIRLTTAQALVRWLAAQRVATPQGDVALFGGVWAIFGHGNVAGLGEALQTQRELLPTFRGHNEQGMAHAAIAYAKAHFRRRMMAVTTSIGPGATNLVTAAALAHVNRLPLLLLPGDIFVSRAPDPVLQQLEDSSDGSVSVNDALRPVSRYFDRIVAPQQLLTALPRALAVLTDAALCGPVTLALPQDVQTQAHDWPASFFAPRLVRFRAPVPHASEVAEAAALLRRARRPLLVAGGGVLYSEGGTQALQAFAEKHGIPVGETQAGKSALPWDHPLQAGPIGVTGGSAANSLAAQADVVIAVGTRLQDFTTGSNTLFAQAQVVSLNANVFDTIKWPGAALQADARLGLEALGHAVEGWHAEAAWSASARGLGQRWRDTVAEVVLSARARLPTYAQVIGAVQASAADSPARDIAVCAAGTLPAELHKLWRAAVPGGYHMEYGYSCMGYEIAGGLGAKMARPDAEVIVMVGDGSYLMLNAELATASMLGHKLIVVVLDNRGYGCIQRLQTATGGAAFNNMLDDCIGEGGSRPTIDFAMNAASLGAQAVHVADVAALKTAMAAARAARGTQVIVIDTTHQRVTAEGGCWWEVGIPEVSTRAEVRSARSAYEQAKTLQRL